MTLEAESSQQPSEKELALQAKVALVQEKLKQSKKRSKEKYDKLSMFMRSKFSDFECSISSNEETDSEQDEPFVESGTNERSI